MLTCGHGGHAQLGHGELRSERAPREVEALRGARVRSASCGGNWTSAVAGAALPCKLFSLVSFVGLLPKPFCWGPSFLSANTQIVFLL